MRGQKLVVISVILASCTLLASGQKKKELMGARRLIEKVAGSVAALPTGKESKPIGESEKFGRDFEQYLKERDSVDPIQAAQAWLGIVERYLGLPDDLKENMKYGELPLSTRKRIDLKKMFAEMPGPASWPELANLIEKHNPPSAGWTMQQSALRLFAFLITQMDEKLIEEFDRMSAQIPENRRSSNKDTVAMIGFFKNEYLVRVGRASPAQIALDRLESELAGSTKSGGGAKEIVIGDLISICGRDQAEQAISKALRFAGAPLRFSYAGPTLDLAREIARREIDKMLSPQWGLVLSTKTTDLFDQMIRRFPNQERNPDFGENRYTRAVLYYLLGILEQDRMDNALQKATQKGFDVGLGGMSKLAATPKLRQLCFDFFHCLFDKKPEMIPWGSFGELASFLHQEELALNLMKKRSSSPDLKKHQRAAILDAMVDMHLRHGRIGNAVSLLKEMLPKSSTAGPAKETPSEDSMSKQASIRLARLGDLLENDEWFGAGIAAARQSRYDTDQILGMLIKRNRLVDAEEMVLDQISINVSKSSRNLIPPEMADAVVDLAPNLIDLVRIYNRAGRHQDVLDLLEKAPWWGAMDLAFMDLGDSGILPMVAEALLSEKRLDEARIILENHLIMNPENDGAYGLLVGHFPASEILPFLDRLYARNRFQTRPLIWKALTLLNMKRLAEAEMTIREAIRIDPTDSEQKTGDRLRANSILADILSAAGNNAEAKSLRKTVDAVRLAKKGDEYFEHGLIEGGLDFYGKAIQLFPEANNVHLRMANGYYSLGDLDKAKEHYFQAYRKMPEQVGVASSLSLSSGNAFPNSMARSIAEEVLQKAEKAGNFLPQVYYLLGELHRRQEHFTEAFRMYKQAVLIDRNYLDAWLRICGLFRGGVIRIPEEQNDALMQSIRLDPMGLGKRFSYSQLQQIDLKRFWYAVSEGRKYFIPPRASLFSLSASRSNIDLIAKKVYSALGMEALLERDNQVSSLLDMQWPNPLAPGEALVNLRIVAWILNSLERGFSFSDSEIGMREGE